MPIDVFEAQNFLMNTNVEQKIFGKNAAIAVQKAADEVRRLESLMSFFISDSEIARINQSAGLKAVSVSNEVMTVLDAALQFAKISGGAFDITFAPVIDLWRRCGKKHELPCSDEISAALSFCGYNNLRLDNENYTVFLLQDGCLIDLGAIGKGYAADRCIELYKSMEVESAFINLGGNVKTLGNRPDGKPWSIGLHHPDKPRDSWYCAIMCSDLSVVTSGAYERYQEINGAKYHHIIDGETGYPSDSNLKSVTVLSQSSMQADALSTAAFVLGLEKGVDLIYDSKCAGAVFFTEANEVYMTKGIKQHFRLFERLPCYEV